MNSAANFRREDWWSRRCVFWGITSTVLALLILYVLGVNATIVGLVVTVALILAVFSAYRRGMSSKSVLIAVCCAWYIVRGICRCTQREQNAMHHAIGRLQAIGGRVTQGKSRNRSVKAKHP